MMRLHLSTEGSNMPNSKIELAMHSLGTQFNNKDNKLQITGWCLHRFRDEHGKTLNPNMLQVLMGTNENLNKNRAGISFAREMGFFKFKEIVLNKYCISIDEAELVNLDIQNKVQIRYGGTVARIGYSFLNRNKGRFKATKVLKVGELACYVKQSMFNGMYLTVREPQIYDETSSRFKSWCAWALAKIWQKNDIVYLFEKECSRYEESASVLYEKLIDAGYDNAYFVVNKDYPRVAELDEKYKKNLINKDSFRHLLYFFKSKVFIGSETMSHAMQLRASDKRIVRKTESKDISYVFLQHGVMYMISLNADLRVSFRQKGLNLYRVVVSSELEAQHFIELAGFEPEELYITGLATFDKSIRNEGADKIVIMPTWRRWESNQARREFTETKYYKMIQRMVNAVPDGLKNKIVILPHPLMQQAMNNSDNELSRYLATDSHDLTLRACDLLITDYSSIAYDAFYRGSNIIFYWEEKDECMRNYGAETKLMIDEDTAFGDVCYGEEQLRESIEKFYGKPQKQEYLDKYRKIVVYHDGRNAERIIELLKKDGVL